MGNFCLVYHLTGRYIVAMNAPSDSIVEMRESIGDRVCVCVFVCAMGVEVLKEYSESSSELFMLRLECMNEQQQRRQ